MAQSRRKTGVFCYAIGPGAAGRLVRSLRWNFLQAFRICTPRDFSARKRKSNSPINYQKAAFLKNLVSCFAKKCSVSPSPLNVDDSRLTDGTNRRNLPQ